MSRFNHDVIKNPQINFVTEQLDNNAKSHEVKVNIILDSYNNNIINDFIGRNKNFLSCSKSNITWFDENTIRIWDILKFNTNDFFDFQYENQSELNHIGTILIIPPKSIFNYACGDIILACDNVECIFNSHENLWTCLVFDINVKYKITRVLNDKFIVFKSKLFKNSKNNELLYDNLNLHTQIEMNKDIFQFSYYPIVNRKRKRNE